MYTLVRTVYSGITNLHWNEKIGNTNNLKVCVIEKPKGHEEENQNRQREANLIDLIRHY